MKYLAILVTTLLFAGCLLSIANAQTPTPEPTPTPIPTPTPVPYIENSISVALVKPDNNSTKTDSYNCTFQFTPTLVGADKLFSATLVLNGSVTTGTNTSALVSGTSSSFTYVLPSKNDTYHWNIILANSSTNVRAAEDFNLTLAVYVAPATSPTPAATPTPTPAPTVAPTTQPTAVPTPSPTPAPTGGLDIWTIVIIVVILVAGFSVIAIVLLRHKH
jgi:hypothetical protein